MGQLSSRLLTALSSPNARVSLAVEIDFVDGTRRWSKYGLNSSANGPYQQRIAKFGQFEWQLSPFGGDLYVPEASFTINDSDRFFEKKVASGERLRDCAVRVYLVGDASPLLRVVQTTDWFKLFGGVLMEWERSEDTLQYTLKCRYSDSFLSKAFPRVWIEPGDWPNAPRDNWGKVAPLVLGRHDSSGFGTRAGAIPTILVDSVNNGYVISYGVCKNVFRYFDGSTQIVTGITFTQDYEINGRHWTYVQFSGSHGDVRVDCLGLDTVGDGSSNMIQFDTEQIRFLLNNFVFTTNATGNLWDYSDVGFDSVLSANVVGREASAYLDGSSTPYTYLSKLLAARPDVRAAWTPAGKLALYPDSPYRAAYDTYPYEIQVPPIITNVVPSWPREDPAGRLYGKLGSGKERLELIDALDPDPASDEMDLSGSVDFV